MKQNRTIHHYWHRTTPRCTTNWSNCYHYWPTTALNHKTTREFCSAATFLHQRFPNLQICSTERPSANQYSEERQSGAERIPARWYLRFFSHVRRVQTLASTKLLHQRLPESSLFTQQEAEHDDEHHREWVRGKYHIIISWKGMFITCVIVHAVWSTTTTRLSEHKYTRIPTIVITLITNSNNVFKNFN